MFGKSLKINFLLGTLIGILGLFYSGWTPSILAMGTTDNFIPARNMIGGALTNPEGIAVDSAGNIWVTHYGNNSVSKLDFNGRPLSPSGGFTGGGLNKPLGIAIDSTGNAWVANYGNNSVSKLDFNGKPLSPSGGFTDGGLNKPFGIAIDSTGNVWVANEGNRFTELIGAASPAEGELSGNPLKNFLNRGARTMETLNVFGAEMMRHELTILQIIVGVGFIGWMLLLLVHTVLLANVPGEESGLDEYGCHFDKKTKIYHCVTGQLAGRDFPSKKDMLKLAA